MKPSSLARVFRRILTASMPVPAASALLACSGQTTASAPESRPDAAADAYQGGGMTDATEPVLETNPQTVEDADAGDTGNPDDGGDLVDAGNLVQCCGRGPLVPAESCHGLIRAIDAGLLESIDAGDAGWSNGVWESGPQCNALGCEISCQTFPDGGTLFVECGLDCTGRRPEGLLSCPPAVGTPLGAYFAEMSRLEGASVAAFRHLRRELVAHGAPKRLVRAAAMAARDEIRHTRLAVSLARRYGAVPVPVKVEGQRVRSLDAMAIENAVEGCVREAFGALIASWQAIAAQDPSIRAAMAAIARDETRHAALAFQVNAWSERRLEASARIRVREARQAALDTLHDRLDEVPAMLRAQLGLPTAIQARMLADQMARIAA
jgi:hypothetical protein